MKLRKLSKHELALVTACLETIKDILAKPDLTPNAEEMIKDVQEQTGLDVKEFIAKTANLFKENIILVMDFEGEEKPKGEPTIIEAPLTEYGQPNPFKGTGPLKGMKFPFKKGGEEHELTN